MVQGNWVDVNGHKCISCAGCVSVCPVNALDLVDRFPRCNDKCVGCNACVAFCPVDALRLSRSKGMYAGVQSTVKARPSHEANGHP